MEGRTPRGDPERPLGPPTLLEPRPPTPTHIYRLARAHTRTLTSLLPSSPNFLCWPDAVGAQRPRALARRVLPAGPSVLGWVGKSKSLPKCDFPLCVSRVGRTNLGCGVGVPRPLVARSSASSGVPAARWSGQSCFLTPTSLCLFGAPVSWKKECEVEQFM